MTLPSSGPLSLDRIGQEAGIASGTNISMSWIYSNTKSGQQSYAVSNYYSKAWYQRNVDGNCNNGNCNCGNCNCNVCDLNCNSQCYAGTQCVNCANCDTRAWFQNNCNCFSQCYNCSSVAVQNCNCDCACPTCFPGDSIVSMADGTKKRIDQIQVGDIVEGGFGYKNRVQMYHKTKIGNWPLYIINGRHRTTGEHKHLTTDGWAVIDLVSGKKPTKIFMTVDNEGNKEYHVNTKFKRTKTHQLKVGMVLLTTDGYEPVESIEIDRSFSSNEYVYTLCTDGSHTHIVAGNLIVGAWVRDIDFDYDTWTPINEVKDNYNVEKSFDSDFIRNIYNKRSVFETT